MPKGYNGSPRAFASTGRTQYQEGPGHILDIGGLVAGAKYEFKGRFKFFDSKKNDEPVTCDKVAAWSDPKSCPLFSIVLQLPTGRYQGN